MLQGLSASSLAMTGLMTPPPPVKALTLACEGTLAVVGKPPFSRHPSYATNQKVRSRMMGPPSDPPNWLLWKVFWGTGLALKKLRASKALLRKNSNAEP